MNTIYVDALTPEDIAGLLPPSWAFTFVDLAAALAYYHSDMTIVRSDPKAPNGIVYVAGRKPR